MDLFSIASHESPAMVFVNPRAGSGRARRSLPAVKRILVEDSFPAEFAFTDTTEALELHARAAIQADRRVLLAMGGDGTLQALANAARGADVVLGILPAGGGTTLPRLADCAGRNRGVAQGGADTGALL